LGRNNRSVAPIIYDEHHGEVLKEENFGTPLSSEYEPDEPIKHLNYV